MTNTLQTTINWAQAFINYSPLTVANAGLDPAMACANMIVNTMYSAPFTWPHNRAENSATSTVATTQDYTFALTDFAFLERASLTDTNGNVFEVTDIKNTGALAISTSPGRPKSMAIISSVPGTSFKLRCNPVPDQIYVMNLTYQKLPVPFTTLAQGWASQTGIPDSHSDIYNNLFLAEAFEAALDDSTSMKYRSRGMAALLSKAEGLTEMQRNIFMLIGMKDGLQALAAQLKTQQAAQARSI